MNGLLEALQGETLANAAERLGITERELLDKAFFMTNQELAIADSKGALQVGPPGMVINGQRVIWLGGLPEGVYLFPIKE